MKHIFLKQALLLLFSLMFLLILSPANAATRVLNSSGGQCSFDGANGGLSVHAGDNSQFQVERCSANGVTSKSRQYYYTGYTPPNQNLFNSTFLRIGSTVFGAYGGGWFGANTAWTSVSSSGGSTLGDGTSTTVYSATTGGLTYTVTQTVAYVFPNDFYTVKLDVAIPSGNTQNVRLYSWTDIMLDGDDNGVCSRDTSFPEYVIADNTAATVYAGYRQRSIANHWDRYWCGFYSDAPNLYIKGTSSGNLPNTLNTANHDVGSAVQWDIGTVANTTFTAEYDFVFSLNKPTLTKRYGPVDGDNDHSMQAGNATTLTFTITNRPGTPAQGSMNFTETLPANITVVGTPTASQCGGTVTKGASGGRDTITLTNGAMVGGTQSCDIVVNVTSNTAAVYPDPASNVTGINKLKNLADATLTITAIPADYSDAPVTYGSSSHEIASGIRLGAATPDAEAAAQPSVGADADDLTGTDDDDSVTSFPSLIAGATSYDLGNIPVSNSTGNTATLYGWIDVNLNGHFDGNEVATASVASGATSANLSWSGLTGVTAGSAYVRLRLTTQALTNTNSATLTNLDTRSTGAASDGEVEDYALTITAPVIVNCPTEATGSGSGYASSGTGLYKNDIFWLDWSCGVVTQFNPGDTVNKSWTLGNGLQINAQISSITAAMAPYNSGDWGGDVLDNLYSGVNPIGLVNVNQGEDPSYTVSFTASLNGVSIPADVVAAEAEDTGGTNESATWTTDGEAWQPIDATGTLSVQFSNAGKTVFMNNDPDSGGGSLLAFSRGVSNISVNMQAGGKEALAFGVFSSFDYGDIASGYPASQGHYMRKSASGGSTPSSLTPVSSLTLATLSNTTAYYLGANQPDADTGDQNSANADGDDTHASDDEDGVTIPALTQGQAATVSATVHGANGYLQGWIDWNGNGNFNDSGEQVALNLQDNGTGDTNAAAGVIAFTLNVPANAATSQTYARFRWSSGSGLNSTAIATDGEVEDYALTITALDYGDAPSNMSSIDASLGAVYGNAWHSITGNVRLGNSIDGESASQSAGLLANGDGGDDDGVAFPLIDTTPVLRAGEGNTLTITAGSAGYLNAWLDWNQDGDWSDVGEQVATNTQLNAGTNTLSLTPALTAPHGATYARFRFTSASVATPTPTGAAVDGEVEDYRVSIVLPKPVAACFGIGNSGFEEPALAISMDILPEDTVPYWGTIAADPASGSNFSERNAIEVWTSGFNGVPAFQGQQFAELNAYVAGMLYQDIETDPGTVLHWSFAHRGRQTNETLNLLVGSPGSEILQRSVTTGTAGWLVYSGTYTVPAGQKITRFGFQAANGGSLGNFLDAINFSANCPDWSDAPASYTDVSHQKVAGFQLGASITNDPGPYQSANADGDASDDGVSIPALAQGQTASITATVSGSGGYLQGWVDWNGNGNFNDGGEQVALNLQDNGAGDTNAAAGTIAFTLNVPANAATSQTFARFRWSTTNNLNGTAAANDGEVEDYALTILAKGIISGTVFRDDDQSNVKDGAETGIDLITVQLYNANGTPTDVSDDTLAATTQTSGGGTYSFPDLNPGSYLLRVDTADADLPAGALIGTTHPQTGITVTAGNTTTVNFGFDIFSCVPGGGTADGAVTAYISKEVKGGTAAARTATDSLDDVWRAAAGLPATGTMIPWLGNTAASMGSDAPALFATYGVPVDVASVNIQPASPCLGSASSASTYLSTSPALQDSAPRPASLYNTSTQPAFWYDAGGDSKTPNAVRFTFASPVKSFGAWFGDLETRTDGSARPAWLRLLDASGNRIGGDISIEPNDISDGTTTSAVDQNSCGSVAPGTNAACGNQSSRWVGFVDSAATARIKHVLLIVGDDDFGDDAGTEQISFIGMDIVQEDFGDAPGYGDASHIMDSATYMGNAPDSELASKTTNGAASDDANDDGVFTDAGLSSGLQGSTFNLEESVTLHIPLTGTGKLYAWFDWNRNGNFSDNGEQVAASVDGSNGTVTVVVNVPLNAQLGSTYARFRFSDNDAAAALPTGTTTGYGEVEDYQIVVANNPETPGTAPRASCSGTWAAGGGGYQSTTAQGVQITATTTAGSNSGWSFAPNDALNAAGVFSLPEFNGAPSLGTVFTWDTSPEDGRNANAANDAETGILTFTFSTPVKNPVIHIDRLGGYGGNSAASPQQLSNSANITPNTANASATFTALAGTTHFEVTSSSIQRTPNEALVWGEASAQSGADNTRYTAMGSVQINGTYSSLALNLNGVGVEGAGADGIEFVVCAYPYDYGDAPDSYGDADHRIPDDNPVYLGTTGGEGDPQTQNAANGGTDGSGDDSDGTDDEDGVENFPTLATDARDYSLNVTVNNTSGSTARLVGWIDFDRSGAFDSDEAISVNVASGASNKIVALTWNNLPGDVLPGDTYVRLRLTTDSSIATGTANTSLPTGTADDGEVEDYAITIGDSGYTVSGTVYNDANVNSSHDAEDGIKDVTVVLYDTAGNTCRSTKTGADGRYSFSGVQPAVADNYVLYEAADESHEAPEACPPVASDPNGYASSTANSQTLTVSTANVSGVDFGDVKVPTFTLENSQVILPNTTVAYPHMFRSAADGTVTFTLTESADPSSIEWGTSLYQDNNCDAALDAGDTAITGSITVNAGDKLCLLTKVLAPANVTAGAQHSLDVTSSFVYGDGSVITLAAEQTRTDITSTSSGTSSDPVGGEGKLSLVKSVWNATRGATVGDNDGSVALPGETLRYTIAYENIGNGELDELVVHDSVPAFTQLGGAGQACGATPPELSTCTPASNGESLDWTFTGKLQAGSSGDVYYEVVVE